MADTIDLQFAKLPGMPGLLARGAIARKKISAEPVFPKAQAGVRAVLADANKVRQYSQVCGFDQSGKTLPITYPHILAFRLHMEILLQKPFPIAPMGLIHLHNEITQYKAIPISSPMDIHCHIEDHRLVERGVEFDIRSQAEVNGELVWDDLSVYMARLPQKNGKNTRPSRPELREFPEREQWQLADNLGRRYAAASGDYNPIHLYAPTARLLGFKRQIAHGMWSKARCVAALQGRLNSEQCRASVAFKTPIFLPASVVLHYGETNEGLDFELRNETGKRPHLSGQLSRL